MNILTQSFWRDEAFTAILSAQNPLEIIRLAAGDATPPLYYLLLHYWINFFGNSEVSIRALGFIFFLAMSYVMYLIGKKIGGGIGIWLALITLTQPFLFNYAFEARTYTLLGLLTSLTIYFYLKGMYLPMALAGAAMLFSHLFGLWVIAILIGWMIYRHEPWVWAAGSLALYLPWIPNYFNFAKISGNFLGPPNFRDLFDKLVQLGLPALLLIAPFFKRVSSHPLFILAAALTFIPILGTFLISQFRPVFIERYLMVIVPGELMILGIALAEAKFRQVAVFIVTIQVVISAYIFSQPQKPPFGDLASYVRSESRVGDTVLNGSSLTYFESLYYGLNGKIYSPKNDIPYYVGKVLIPDSDILTTVPASKRFWLINLDEPGGTLAEEFPGRLISESRFGRLKLSLYEPTPP